MRAAKLTSAMKLASKVSNPSSLVPLFRCVELGPDTLRACSEFGNIEIAIGETRFDEPALIECELFNEILRSLPNNTEVYLTRAGDRLLWETERGGGQLIVVAQDDQIPPLTHKNYPWIPPETFAQALIRAQLACQSATVSVGMFGIVLARTDGDLRLLSRNALSLSAVTVEDNGFPADKITLRPPTPSILASILPEYPESLMDVTEEGIFVVNDCLTAHLPVRHTAITRMVGSGIPLLKIAAIVGWSKSTTVLMASRYSHFTTDDLREGVDSISKPSPKDQQAEAPSPSSRTN